jgi:hypothetical protein
VFFQTVIATIEPSARSGVAEPVGGGDAEFCQMKIEEAAAGQEDKLEQSCRGDQRDQHRQHHHRTQHRVQPAVFGKPDREGERQRQAGDDGARGIGDGIARGGSEMRVREQPEKIADARVRCLAEALLGEGAERSGDDRPIGERGQEAERRCQQPEGGQCRPGRPPRARGTARQCREECSLMQWGPPAGTLFA